ncbi:MAG: DUF2933 domain-containing protein [Chloroflexi bacterium]|nr:DUF2933 domain-containing protein [Chloroflexota bacterium]
MSKVGGICLNWKVVAGLAALGLGIWVVAPNLVGAALPLLLLAACPLSMLLMMRGMQHGQCESHPAPVRQPARPELTRAQQLAELKTQLVVLQAQHETIAREIARLEAASAPVVREAESVTPTPGERVQRPPERNGTVLGREAESTG